jgi:hypothetical protein
VGTGVLVAVGQPPGGHGVGVADAVGVTAAAVRVPAFGVIVMNGSSVGVTGGCVAVAVTGRDVFVGVAVTALTIAVAPLQFARPTPVGAVGGLVSGVQSTNTTPFTLAMLTLVRIRSATPSPAAAKCTVPSVAVPDAATTTSPVGLAVLMHARTADPIAPPPYAPVSAMGAVQPKPGAFGTGALGVRNAGLPLYTSKLKSATEMGEWVLFVSTTSTSMPVVPSTKTQLGCNWQTSATVCGAMTARAGATALHISTAPSSSAASIGTPENLATIGRMRASPLVCFGYSLSPILHPRIIAVNIPAALLSWRMASPTATSGANLTRKCRNPAHAQSGG